MPQRPTVVLAHYDSEILSRYRETLETEGFRVQATSSGPDVLRRVEKDLPDAVVIEALLQRMNGLTVLKRLKESRPHLRVLVMIDAGDTYTENRALICGADAILQREESGGIPEGALAAKLRALCQEDRLEAPDHAADTLPEDDLARLLETSSKNLRAENPIVAHITDALTGLYNAPYMQVKLAEEVKRTRRFGLPLTLVELQLDAPGEISDTDSQWRQRLNEVAGLLLCESRDIDVLARIDAATFRLLLPHTDLAGARAMMERVLSGISERDIASLEDGQGLRAVAGLAGFDPETMQNPEDLVESAGNAAQSAWQGGTGTLHVWTPEGRGPTPQAGP
ncbi:MAG TPA: diguanylate cyclase [Planctomycetes bacterium]|nr:diguanylate cyclase [Planctomycetota bacterium]